MKSLSLFIVNQLFYMRSLQGNGTLKRHRIFIDVWPNFLFGIKKPSVVFGMA